MPQDYTFEEQQPQLPRIKTKVFKLLNTKTQETYFIEVFPKQQIVAIEFLAHKLKTNPQDYVYVKLPKEEMNACWQDKTRSCYAVKSSDIYGIFDRENAVIPEQKIEKVQVAKPEQKIDANRAYREFRMFMDPNTRNQMLQQTNDIVKNQETTINWDFGFPIAHFTEDSGQCLYRFKSFASAYWYVRKNLIDTNLANEPYILVEKTHDRKSIRIVSEFTNLEQLDSILCNLAEKVYEYSDEHVQKTNFVIQPVLFRLQPEFIIP